VARSMAHPAPALPVWSPVSPEHPCPVCGGIGGCVVDRDDPALVCCCLRASPLPVPGGGWLHVLPDDHRPP
jgi:hypothetical protein